MTIITAILDFLFMTWVFWPIILVLPFVAYYNVTNAVKDNECEVFAGVLIAGIVGILAYKYPAVRGYFDGWRAWAVVLGGYVAAGFLLSLYKWLVVLWDFRKGDIKGDIAQCKREYNNEYERNFAKGYSVTSMADRVERAFPKCNTTANEDGTFTVFPNWKKYPIGTWWTYWPFFLLELPFDFVKRIMENLFNWLRHFYNSIAQRFSVRA
jgi:hypothetical protein